MDRNSIIGFILIGVLLVVYTVMNQPTQQDIERHQRQEDSIAQVKKLKQENIEDALPNRVELGNTDVAINDIMGENSSLAEETYTLENELVKLTLSNKGGRITAVELKKYKSSDKKPLILWDNKENQDRFGLLVSSQGNVLNTQSLFFTANRLNDSILVMSSVLPNNEEVNYTYRLPKDSYNTFFTVHLKNLTASGMTPDKLNFIWREDIKAQEKGRTFESRYTSIYYKEYDDDVDNLSSSKEMAEKTFEKDLRWVAFKSQFFSSVLITDSKFSGVKIESSKYDDTSASPYLKRMGASIPLTYNGESEISIPLKFYFGPNEYKTLRNYGSDVDLQELVDLGWGPIAWVNRFLVVEIFNFLEKYVTGNYGIIILLLTVIIKLLLSPLTYKSYLSSAKMRVLKPQIEEINERIPKEKAMERQQATMELYRKVGVNPMGGCIPMIVQMPILFAMFYFFPVAIQLRQKSFLWADDLSSYDSIASLPFNIPFYGDHVSLFTLLMAVTNLVYTYINMQNQPTTSQPGMPNMKIFMYLMPIIFLGVFNQYASGLSYYYFIATLFTIIQTIIIRQYMLNDSKLLAQLEENKAKPKKPKSNFRKRLEEMQKEQAKQRDRRNK